MRRALPSLLLLPLLAGVLITSSLSPAQAADGQPRGIDVARYQHPNGAVIDWRQVRGAGGSFVYVKAVEGTSYVNPYFRDDVARARAAGLAAGAYDFVRPALPLTTALDQANAFLRVIGDQHGSRTLPPALDLETTGGLSRGDLTAWAQLWLDEVRARTGRTPVLYSYPHFLRTAVYGPGLHNARLWIATYGGPVASPVPGDWPDYTIWQNSAEGHYPGIASAVDTNVLQGTPADLAELADGSAPTSWPQDRPSTPIGVSLERRTRGTLTLRWLPGNDGGSRTTGWQVVLNDGRVLDLPATGTAAVLTGLNPGLTYTAALLGVNAQGPGAEGMSNPAQPLGPTALSIAPGPLTTYGGQVAATGRLTSAGVGVGSARVEVQQRSGSTWSTLTTVLTGSDGGWRWASTATANQVLRAVYTGTGGYVSSATGEVLRRVAPAVSISAPAQVRTGGTWNVAAALQPATPHVVRLLVLLGGRWAVVSSATTDSRGVVHLAWRGAQAGNRTARLQVGAAGGLVGVDRRLDVRVV